LLLPPASAPHPPLLPSPTRRSSDLFDPALDPLPTLRDPDNLIYFRTEVGGLVMGGYERKPAPWAIDGIPDGFEAKLLPQEWERRSEEHTSELQSRGHLVCRLLLEKK